MYNTALSDYGGGPNLELQRALVEDIYRIIRNGPIYTSQRFAGVELPKEILDVLKEKPEGEDLIRLNRALLHEAYPQEIVTSDSEPKAKYQKVGLKRPNPWGLYDMLGNVGEMVSDWYSPDPLVGVVTDPTGPASGTGGVIRVVCGGSYISKAEFAGFGKAPWNDYGQNNLAYSSHGFRVVTEHLRRATGAAVILQVDTPQTSAKEAHRVPSAR
jgi:hypothetical protein